MHLILGEVQPATKPTESQVEKEKGTRPFGPARTAETKGRSTRLWPFTPRAGPAISFGGQVAKETSNLCYILGMVDDEGPVEKAIMASSSDAITSQDIVNSNLVTLMLDSGASGHYFDDAIIHDRKHRLQGYVHLATLHKILTVGGALLADTLEGVLQGFVLDGYGNQTSFGPIS